MRNPIQPGKAELRIVGQVASSRVWPAAASSHGLDNFHFQKVEQLLGQAL